MAIRKVCGIETEYGIVLRGVGESNPVTASSLLINAYVSQQQRKVEWDFEDESPGRALRPHRAARDAAFHLAADLHGGGEGGVGGALRRRPDPLPADAAGRLLRGRGRTRDHVEATNREHAR